MKSVNEKQIRFDRCNAKPDPFAFFEIKKHLPISLYIYVGEGRNISKGEENSKKG